MERRREQRFSIKEMGKGKTGKDMEEKAGMENEDRLKKRNG